MLFNSPEFLVFFLPATLLAFFVAAKLGRGQTLVLLAASLAFYAAWSIRYLPLLLFSMAMNFGYGLLLQRWRGSRWLLGLGVASNLALLGYFKYAGFIVGSVGELLHLHLTAPHIVLPLGISFFTFTQIAFLVDAFQGKVVDKNPGRYALFVSFFPHLIAGPILHHEEMTSQFRDFARKRVTGIDLSVGITIFIMGFIKKVALADAFSPYVAAGFDHPGTAAAAWTAVLAYALQLYFDFSGYSDMAIGLARLLGVKMPENFNSPYKARSIADFWTRWHMTLSRFLRDYLYVPLGGNRKGAVRTYVNVFVTMLLGGLWHGAAWTFVVWGALHGAYIVIARLWTTWAAPRGMRLGPFGAALTFLCVLLAWVPFRSRDLGAMTSMLYSMVGTGGIGRPDVQASALIGVGLGIVWLLPNTQQLLMRYEPVLVDSRHTIRRGMFEWRFTPAFGIGAGLSFLCAILLANDVSEFLYFQF